MIFHIDSRIPSYLEGLTGADRRDSVAKIGMLLMNRYFGRNVVVGNLITLKKIRSIQGLAAESYEVLDYICANYVEENALRNSVNFYINISPDIVQNVTNDDGVIVINKPLNSLEVDLFSKTQLLVENEIDAKFFKIIAEEYIRSSVDLAGISIAFDIADGGGATTGKIFKRTISDNSRCCLCIVDSDRAFPEAQTGSTGKAVMRVYNAFGREAHCVYHQLVVREAENLIPIHVLRQVAVEYGKDYLVDFVELLPEVKLMYFDCKKGVRAKPFFHSENGQMLFNFWSDEFPNPSCQSNLTDALGKVFLNSCVGKAECDCRTCASIIRGFGDRLLERAVEILSQCKGFIDQLPNSIRAEWECIGSLLFTWCVVARRSV